RFPPEHPPPTRTNIPSLHDALPISAGNHSPLCPASSSESCKFPGGVPYIPSSDPAGFCQRCDNTRRPLLPFPRRSRRSSSARWRSEEHTSELQSRFDLVCRLLLEEK